MISPGVVQDKTEFSLPVKGRIGLELHTLCFLTSAKRTLKPEKVWRDYAR